MPSASAAPTMMTIRKVSHGEIEPPSLPLASAISRDATVVVVAVVLVDSIGDDAVGDAVVGDALGNNIG